MTRLLLSFLGLLMLLALTVAASFASLGAWSLVVSLSVSLLKTLLIVFVFMQLSQASTLIRLAAIAGVVWLSILFILSFADFAQRDLYGATVQFVNRAWS